MSKKYFSPYTEKISLRLCELMPIIEERLAEGKTVEIKPTGVSMRPFLKQERDSVVLSAIPSALKKYDIVLYEREPGEYVLHRIFSIGKAYTLMGDALNFFEKGIEQRQLRAIVVSIKRKGRTVNVNSQRYIFCVKIWYFIKRVRRALVRILRKLK